MLAANFFHQDSLLVLYKTKKGEGFKNCQRKKRKWNGKEIKFALNWDGLWVSEIWSVLLEKFTLDDSLWKFIFIILISHGIQWSMMTREDSLLEEEKKEICSLSNKKILLFN